MTSLLVLVSLFSQTSEKMPKTAYLKLIDNWFLALIVYDFLVIIDVVLMECYKIGQVTKLSFVCTKKHASSDSHYQKSINRINNVSRYVFFVFFLCIVTIFGYLAEKSVNKEILNLKSKQGI